MSTSKRIEQPDAENGGRELEEVVSPDTTSSQTLTHRKKSKKSKKTERDEPAKKYDKQGREIDSEGWLVDPTHRLLQKRIERMYASLFTSHIIYLAIWYLYGPLPLLRQLESFFGIRSCCSVPSNLADVFEWPDRTLYIIN